MSSTCTIREVGSEPVTDEDGKVTFPPGATVYSGPCRVRPGTSQSTTTKEAGGVELFTFDYLISVPFSVSEANEGHRVTVDSSPDPALVGVEVEVQKVDRGEHITARRLFCAEVK